jgi:quercetin dioxygenase-like cupin family protein
VDAGKQPSPCFNRRRNSQRVPLLPTSADSGGASRARNLAHSETETPMAQAHAAPGDIIDVGPLGAAIAGHVTTAILKSAQLELVHIVLPAGKALREHSVAGEITLQCIEGLIDFTTPTISRRLAAGQLIHLPAGEPHALRAVADSTALLTICLVPK